MRVAIVSHAYQDERYLTTLDAMARYSAEEIMLIHPERYMGRRWNWHGLHSVAHIPVPVYLGSRQGGFFYRWRALAHALKQARPDVLLHEQEVYALSAGQIAWMAHHLSIPLVQFVWENVDRELPYWRWIVPGYALSHAAALIAGSEGAKRQHAQWGFKGQTAVMPQMSVFTGVRPRRERGDRHDLSVCFVGRLVTCKGVDCLLRAVALLHWRGVQIECSIAGEGPERRRFAALARELGIWGLVDFRGFLPEREVGHLLAVNDVLVLPSRRTKDWEEQFGLVLAEAMAEGAVTVGSKTGAIPEVIGTAELLFEEDNAEGLAAILHRLATDSNFYRRSQQQLWARARQRFDTHVVATQKLLFLHSVLEHVPVSAMKSHSLHTAIPVS